MLIQKKRVVVGMSGGVDSSVAAYLLLEQGFEVIGIFMKNWQADASDQYCQAANDFKDVVSVCEQLNIPYYSVNFSEEYQENVFSKFIEDSKNGLTPNPDVLCNREIKFKYFFDFARKLGADFVATGHYAQVHEGHLLKGKDLSKDQSYFLSGIDPSVLPYVLFPLGGLLKSEVREIAKKINLKTALKKDSTGICFIGERPFRDFLSQYIKSSKGRFIDLEGHFLGDHEGLPFYTIGQRKGLGVGGPGEPWFVADKNIKTNEILLVQGENHPKLFFPALVASEFHWLTKPKTLDKLTAKIRYRQDDQECLVIEEEGYLKVYFSIPQRAITPGQYIVFYQGDHCLGCARIQYPFEGSETDLEVPGLTSLGVNPWQSPDPADLTI
jgi:tRNA-specific 2-thiouridylase